MAEVHPLYDPRDVILAQTHLFCEPNIALITIVALHSSLRASQLILDALNMLCHVVALRLTAYRMGYYLHYPDTSLSPI